MITGISHVTLSVNDMGESFSFYKDVLDFTPVMKSEFSAYFLGGDLWVALVEEKERKGEESGEYTHIAFAVPARRFEEAKAKLVKSRVASWKENESEGESYYFRDPNGHRLEIHATDLWDRIEHGKKKWGTDVEWFV
ncbi:MAG: VOC family protein [Planctomycetota bacterium]|jgi:catechol 2,3-dioxygenase-like lactoylglutathione lyase family enzyme